MTTFSTPNTDQKKVIETLEEMFRVKDGSNRHYEMISPVGGRHTLRATEAVWVILEGLDDGGYAVVPKSEIEER